MDWFTTLFAPITAWMDNHPAGVAWLMSWAAALGTSQTVKSVILPPSWSGTQAKRATQLTAMLVGGLVAFYAWPTVEHRAVAAVTASMSAPTAYTFLRALIETLFPKFAANLSWQSIQARAGISPCAINQGDPQ